MPKVASFFLTEASKAAILATAAAMTSVDHSLPKIMLGADSPDSQYYFGKEWSTEDMAAAVANLLPWPICVGSPC